MNTHFELIVIGAGTAGMQAATLAAEFGVSVLLLDEQRHPGGQIFKSVEHNHSGIREQLEKDYATGKQQAAQLRNSKVQYQPDTTVWHMSAEKQVWCSHSGQSWQYTADEIIVASGAQERPMPFPGWTLPGVMHLGGAQILLKESGLVATQAVFVGMGPLLYLVAHQYMLAGHPPAAIIDTTPNSNYIAATRFGLGALAAHKQLRMGLQWKRAIIAAGTTCYTHAHSLQCEGTDAVEAITFKQGSTQHRIACEHLFTHAGVIPSLHLSEVAGCTTYWNSQQHSWSVKVDDTFQSSIASIAIVGDGSAIMGAESAQLSGYIAACATLHRLKHLTSTAYADMVAPAQKKWRASMRIRPFLDRLFAPPPQLIHPQDDNTIVCRCEEISAGEIRTLIANGHSDPNQIKSFSRCGMGPCQGRMCGLTVSGLIAQTTGKDMETVGRYRLRPPIKPLPLSELAAMQHLPEGQ